VIDWDTLVVGPTTDVFGEQFRYRTVDTPGAPSVAFTVTGIFDEPDTTQFEDDTFRPAGVLNTKPRVGVQLSQFLPFGIEPTQDDLLTRVSNGRCYQVLVAHKDSHGGATLALNNVPDTVNPP
jgi:hypothetical protein